MDLTFSSEDLKFRDEVVAFCETQVDRETREKIRLGHRLTKGEIVDYHRALYARGWAVPNWAPEWGGLGWSALRNQIFEEVTAAHHCPRRLAFGVSMVGPVLQAFGSREQQER